MVELSDMYTKANSMQKRSCCLSCKLMQYQYMTTWRSNQ